MVRQKAIICDLDGTLYDARERQRIHLMSGKKDFDGFHRAARADQPHSWCQHLLQSMRAHGVATVFTSGRDDTYRRETEEWLAEHMLWENCDYRLLMRPAGDYTADDEMKRGWYRERIKPQFEVLFAVDDRKRVAKMWREEGLTCLHCDEGDF